jgi:hypothetical protein
MKADKLKWHRRKNREATCRGSLAWLGRQTHNLEFARGKRPTTRSRGLESRPMNRISVYSDERHQFDPATPKTPQIKSLYDISKEFKMVNNPLQMLKIKQLSHGNYHLLNKTT